MNSNISNVILIQVFQSDRKIRHEHIYNTQISDTTWVRDSAVWCKGNIKLSHCFSAKNDKIKLSRAFYFLRV